MGGVLLDGEEAAGVGRPGHESQGDAEVAISLGGALPPCESDTKLLIRVEGKLSAFTLMKKAQDWFLFPDDVRLGAASYSIFADDDGQLLLREKGA